ERIVTVYIFGGISFGVAELLRFGQSLGKRDPRGLDAREDVIAGPIQNSAKLNQFVARETFLKARDEGDASRHRSPKRHMPTSRVCLRNQFGAIARDNLLVAGYN